MYWYDPYGAYLTAEQPSTVQQRTDRKYSEDLMAANVGRQVTVYLTYDRSKTRNDVVVNGTLRQVGRDFILVTDQNSGKDTMLFNINIDYIVFDRKAALASE